MLLPASIEFTNLCRTQVALLMQSFEASMGAVYLSKDLPAHQQSDLIPVIIYPEDSAPNRQPAPLRLPASTAYPDLAFQPASLTLADQDDLPSGTENSELEQDQALSTTALTLTPAQQVVIPLIHEERVLGLLVVARDCQSWSETEQSQLQRIADTLAIACILDQRSQWLANAQYQQRAFQSEQQQTFSNLLHQFRNPLTALKTLGKLLQKRFNEDDNSRKIAASIVEQSDRLENMLRQFDGAIDWGEAALETLDADPWVAKLSKVTPALPPSLALPLGEDELHLQPCWFADVLRPLLQSAIGRTDQKNLQLTVRIPADMPAVLADIAALREICSNLLDNALKYTSAGGEVQVEVCHQWRDEDQPEQVLLISDSGPGIPQADLTRIFERQYRGIQAQTEIPGTGLGLAIAQVLVEQMQGEIRAFSPRIDQPQAVNQTSPGSTFMVKLPESEVKVIN